MSGFSLNDLKKNKRKEILCNIRGHKWQYTRSNGYGSYFFTCEHCKKEMWKDTKWI